MGMDELDKSKELESLSEEMTKAKETIRVLSEQLSAREVEIQDLKTCDGELAQAKSALAKAEGEIAEMKEAEAKSTIAEQKAIEGLQNNLVEATEQKTQLESEVAKLRSEAAEFVIVREGLGKQLKETKLEMDNSKELESSNEELASTKETVRVLSEQLSAREVEIQDLKSSQGSGTDEIHDLKTKLEDEKGKRIQADATYEKLLEANESLSSSRRSLEKQVEELKAQTTTMQAEITDLKGRIPTETT